jgi:hypothetical protein
MEAEHQVWETGGKGRKPGKRIQLLDEVAALRVRAGQWARDMGNQENEWIEEVEDGECIPRARSHGMMAGRMHFAHILATMANACASLKGVYAKAVLNYKSARDMDDKQSHRAYMEATQDSTAMLQSLAQAVEDICLSEDAGESARPLSHRQLCICADRLCTFPIMPLSKLLLECGGRPDGESIADIKGQLVRKLPLICVDTAPRIQGPHKDKSILVLNPYHEKGPRIWASMRILVIPNDSQWFLAIQ